MKKKSVLKYTLINHLFRIIKLNSFCRKWHRLNPNNDTIPQNMFPIDSVNVGDYSYGELNVVTFDSKTKLSIGRFVSIAQNVTFLLDVEHYTDNLSTYPFKVKMLYQVEPETFSKGDIIISDDVWIGYGATIMSGVHIGQGAIVAAGSVVTRDIPPYAIVGGVPAKVIKYRFEDEILNKLKELNYQVFNTKNVQDNISLLYSKLESEGIDKIIDNMK